MRETRALWRMQMEPGGDTRACPLPAVVFVPITPAQPNTWDPFKDNTLVQWVLGIHLKLKWPLEDPIYSPLFLVSSWTAIYHQGSSVAISGWKTQEQDTSKGWGRTHQLTPVCESSPSNRDMKVNSVKWPVRSMHRVRDSPTYCAVVVEGKKHCIVPLWFR